MSGQRVMSSVVNCNTMMSDGIPFHMRAAATPKAWSPIVTSCYQYRIHNENKVLQCLASTAADE